MAGYSLLTEDGSALLTEDGSVLLTEGGSDPIVLFEVELESYLRDALGVPVWAGKVPQGKGSATVLVYNLVGSDDHDDLDGPTGLGEVLVQFDAYARTRLLAATLVERLRRALHGYRGPMGGLAVQNVVREGQGHGYDPVPDGSPDATQRRMVEFRFFFDESIPTF